MSLVKISIFSYFLGFCNEIQNSLVNTMISTGNSNNIQVFPRAFSGFRYKLQETPENIMVLTTSKHFLVFLGIRPKNPKKIMEPFESKDFVEFFGFLDLPASR